MSNIDSIIKTVNTVIVVVFLLIALTLILARVDKAITSHAIETCASISYSESRPASGSIVRYPLPEVYQQCLKDKGVEASAK